MQDVDWIIGPVRRHLDASKTVLDFIGYLIDTVQQSEAQTSLPALSGLEPHFPLLWEMVFQRFVDNFLHFISDQMTLLFIKRPEMLSTEEKISYKEALEYDTREELIAALAERKVTALSYKGFRDLSDYLEEKHGVVLFENPSDLQRAVTLIEKRNLIAHNQGRVSQRYLDRVPEATEKVGDKLDFKHDYVFAERIFLGKAVVDINKRAAEKFLVPLLGITPKGPNRM